MRGVIVLNKNYQFWDEIPVRRAVNKIIKNKAKILAHNGKFLGKFEGKEIWLPLIIQLLEFVSYKCKSEKVYYSDSAVYDRDDNYCQYWHDYKLDSEGRPIKMPQHKHKCTEDERTVDHIVPLSRGGRSSFENVVCACRYCNEILKKNRTPDEASMKLIKTPITPRKVIGEMVQRKFIYNPKKPSHQEYLKLIYQGEWK